MKPKVGLLPFYLELYDLKNPEMRKGMEEFLEIIVRELGQRNMDVIKVPPARIRDEFESSVHMFEKEGAVAIVTLHLAYSPSLESIESLSRTPLPIIVMDTTYQYDFGPGQSPSAISYNHGIHGVQDMCNLLLRRGKPFLIEAGHWRESNLLERIEDGVGSALLLYEFLNSRIGRLGESFKGMGDFHVEEEVLKKDFNMEIVKPRQGEFSPFVEGVTLEEIKNEMELDRKTFISDGLNESTHIRNTRIGLGVRKWIDHEGLDGFSINFLSTGKDLPLNVMPFLEAGKAMARKIGYAGEGDVLTAGFVGCLAKVFTEVSFTEMFCPDWKGNRIFLSHMGEINVDLIHGKGRLMEKEFSYTDAHNPIIPTGRFKSGEAMFVNLAPAREGYNLIVARGSIPEIAQGDKMEGTICGWFKPEGPIGEFLEKYSLAGGTHHGALVYGGERVLKQIKGFGKLAGFNAIEI